MLQFEVLPNRFAVCQLDMVKPLPNWVFSSSFYTVSKTADELAVVCEEDLVQDEIVKSVGWRLLKINAVLDLSLTGITAQFSTALAKAGVNLSVIATYNTDYILVEEAKLTTAIEALRGAGFEVIE
ncbi:MAG: ACT domain-containing protein [Cyclobacteriaceae bacterium]